MRATVWSQTTAPHDYNFIQSPIYLIRGTPVRLCSSRIIGTAPAIGLIPRPNSLAPEHFRSILMTYLANRDARALITWPDS
jgi:hypothetical protein